MRYGLVGDVHGSELRKAEKEFHVRKVDYGICLGDFDRAHIARQMMEMQIESNIPWIVVPGNHDHSHINRVKIYSGTMTDQGINSEMMWSEWELPENKDAREYVEGMLENKPVVQNSARRIAFYLDEDPDWKVVVIHGAYAGDFQGQPADLWTRLRREADYKKNFEVMEKKGYKIMIRGHDHFPIYTYKDPEKGVVSYDGENGKEFRLFKQRVHTINPGAFFDGNFAIIDTDVPGEKQPMLTYHRL